MPELEISPKVHVQLEAAARARGCTPAELIATWLGSSSAGFAPPAPLVAFIHSPEFRAKFSDADRYLALLSWIAREYPTEFSDFIAHYASGRKYLGLSPEEIRETCRHNQARAIEGTHYWAIMNLDTATKRRFLRRLLVFVGAPDDAINQVTATISGR